jgi:hypothetical protein
LGDFVNAVRLLGREASCRTSTGCPGVLLLDNGDFAFIGADATEWLSDRLPPGSGVAESEGIVVVSRSVLIDAMPELLQLLAES